jgi:hypothetical protein
VPPVQKFERTISNRSLCWAHVYFNARPAEKDTPGGRKSLQKPSQDGVLRKNRAVCEAFQPEIGEIQR